MTDVADLPPIPYSIRLFERMQITALAVGWITAAVVYRTMLHDRVGPLAFTAALAGLSGMVVLLVFRISRRRSTNAKRLLIVLSALATAPWFELLNRTAVLDLPGLLTLFMAGLQLASLGLLLTPAARAWFLSRQD